MKHKIIFIILTLCSFTFLQSLTLDAEVLNKDTTNIWVKGDSHTHSMYSDGLGTITDNMTGAMKNGMDFITITDHNTQEGYKEVNGDIKDLSVIRGMEYTKKDGHLVLINTNENIQYKETTIPKFIDYIKTTSNDTLIYIAHPYEPSNSFADENWSSKIDGIEVWNGWGGAKHPYNEEAFKRWDLENNKGRHLYGIAQTDSHVKNTIGKTYTSAFVKRKNITGIIEAYKNGHIYGSNGPEINFSIGDKMMGDTIKLNSSTEKIEYKISGSYTDELDKVLIIKNGSVLHEYKINNKTFNIKDTLEVTKGDFIRVEVFGNEIGNKTHSMNGFITPPFAFSNPIFFE